MSNAVFLASGKSSRMWPLTMDRPKGLLRVKGEVLVERQIEQLHECGITEIIFISTDNNMPSWQYLGDRYGVEFIRNDKPDWNNCYTLSLLGDRLGDTFICSVDNYFPTDVMNPAPFDRTKWSWYGTSFTAKPKDEWFVLTRGGSANGMRFINGVSKIKATGMYMCGCAYLNERDGRLLAKYLGENSSMHIMWEDVLLRHIDEFDIQPRHIGVVEFDSIYDLLEYDPDYFEPIGNGETNSNYAWEDKVIRIPGKGIGETIDRHNEKEINARAAAAGVDFSYIAMKDGIKLSRRIDGRGVDPRDWDEVAKAFKKIDIMHGMATGTKNINRFDVLSDARRLLTENELDDWRRLFCDLENLEAIRDWQERKDFCICHNDFHPGNTIVTDDDICIIDWEYAGISDRYNDIGSWLSCVDYDEDEAMKCIEVYGGGMMDSIIAAERCSFRWYVWCLVQEMAGLGMDGWTELCLRNWKMYERMRIRCNTDSLLESFGQ